MFEGKRFYADRVNVKLSAGVTVTGGSIGDPSWSTDGECALWRGLPPSGPGFERETPSFVDESDDFIKNLRMYAARTQDGDSWAFHWRDQPPDGVGAFYEASGTGAHSLRVEIDNYELYTRFDGTWRLRMGESRLLVGGVLYKTFSAIQIDSSGPIGPRDTPCPLGMLTGFGTSDASSSVGPDAAAAEGWAYSTSLVVEGAAEIGIEYVIDGITCAWPVSFLTPVVPSMAGTSAALATVTGTNSWDCVIHSYSRDLLEDNWCQLNSSTVIARPYRTKEVRNARTMILPNDPREVKRMSLPTESLVVRGGMPQTTRIGTRSKQVSSGYFPDLIIGGGSVTTSQVSATVMSEYSSLLLPIGDEPGLIEEPLTKTVYAAVLLSGSYGEAAEASIDWPWPEETGPAACTVPDWRTGRIAKGDDVSFQYPERVQTIDAADALSANSGIISQLSHRDALVRLYQTWHCPLWHYALWFPPNTIDTNADEIPDVQDVWKVFGAEIEAEYWGDSRQQWINHPALDEGDATNRRNLVRSEPLRQSRLRGLWQDIYYGLPTSPLGISRFEAQVPTVPASLVTNSDSASLLTALTSCTVNGSGSTIVVNPSASTCEVAMDWAKFQTKPWLFAAMASQFKFSWVTTNIVSVVVYAEGWDGTRVQICSNAQRGTWLDWPTTGTATKFAGSWQQAFGRGYITDDGADVDADGISSATMADVVRSAVFGLLPGRTARRIVWAIQVTDHAIDINLNWPEFRHTSHRFLPEIAQQGPFLSPSGPGVRFGNHGWWNYGTDAWSDPPQLQGPETTPTALDGLAARRVYFEGKAADDGLNTELEAIYEDGIEYTIVRKHQALDPTDGGQSTHSFWVQGTASPVLILVSSMREVPPMGGYPVRDRDANFEPTDDFGQFVWICHERDRYYMSAAGAIRLYDGAEEWPEPELIITVPGWKIRSHSRAVTNDEDLFDVIRAAIVLARIRPWHGCFAILGEDDEGEPMHVASINMPWGGFVLGWSDGEGVRIARWDRPVPIGSPAVTYRFEGKSVDDTQPRFRIGLNLCRLYVTFQRAFSLMESFSDDDGATWSEPEEITTGIRWQDTWDDKRGFEGRATFVYDSGTSGPGKIWVEVREPGESSFGASMVVGGGTPVSFADSSFKIVAAPDEQSSWILSAIKAGGTVPTNYRSTDDGATWTEI